MTTEGIKDLARIEEQDIAALDEVRKLKVVASFCLVFAFLGYLVHQGLEMVFFFKIYFWMSFFIFSGNYIDWNQKYSQKIFPPEDAKEIKKQKRESLIIFACTAVFGAIVYAFLLK